jgi:hypothetical protein
MTKPALTEVSTVFPITKKIDLVFTETSGGGVFLSQWIDVEGYSQCACIGSISGDYVNFQVSGKFTIGESTYDLVVGQLSPGYFAQFEGAGSTVKYLPAEFMALGKIQFQAFEAIDTEYIFIVLKNEATPNVPQASQAPSSEPTPISIVSIGEDFPENKLPVIVERSFSASIRVTVPVLSLPSDAIDVSGYSNGSFLRLDTSTGLNSVTIEFSYDAINWFYRPSSTGVSFGATPSSHPPEALFGLGDNGVVCKAPYVRFTNADWDEFTAYEFGLYLWQ